MDDQTKKRLPEEPEEDSVSSHIPSPEIMGSIQFTPETGADGLPCWDEIRSVCPICGGTGEVDERYSHDWIVECPTCGFGTGGYPSIEQAIRAWNRRIPLDRLENSESCPLCGAASTMVERDEGAFYRECTVCMCSTDICETEIQAENRWRTRYVKDFLDRPAKLYGPEK